MWLMDRFFDGEFLSYGWRVMNLADTPQEQRYDPMVSEKQFEFRKREKKSILFNKKLI